MKSFLQLKKNLKNDFTGLLPVKIALLGDSPTQLLAQALRGAGFDAGLDLQILDGDFDQIERQVFDISSALYQSGAEASIVFHSTEQLLAKYDRLLPEQRTNLSTERLDLISQLNTTLQSKGIKLIYYNYPELDDALMGNYANKTLSSFLYQLRKLNFGLMEYAAANSNFYLVDLSLVQNQMGRSAFFQPSVYLNTGLTLSLDALPAIAARAISLLSAINGREKKCLVFDLDNTVWGGILGDDGPEHIQLGELGIGKAFTGLQHWIKKLQQRGIILAVCSKNDEAAVRDVFERHPDMVLRPEDIAVFRVNWNNKADNIREVHRALNIGFDSMVFIDDNPFERELVRAHIPGITVPELPEDPADYLEYLCTFNLFETVSVTGADKTRTQQYQAESTRQAEKLSYVDEAAFLQSLDMVATVESFTPFNIPRIAQLSQRSNQFNLRTVRYTETDIEQLANEPGTHGFAFSLHDRFGDHGLTGVAVLKSEDNETLFIDTWLMSCRVLSRSMEQFTLNTIACHAYKQGYHFLKGQYLPTPKNAMVKNLYARLGFLPSGDFWLLDVRNYQSQPTFISQK